MILLDNHEGTDHRLKSLPRMPTPPPIAPIPQPHPSFPPTLPELPESAVRVASFLYNKAEWVQRTYFGPGFGELHCVATASKEVFLLFLNQLRYSAIGYKETLIPWKSRYHLIGKLLSGGYIQLYRAGGEFDKNATFYLVPSAMAPTLTCLDLYHEKRWDYALCCKECHGDFRLLSEISDLDLGQPFTGDFGPEGRKVLVCCRTAILLPTTYFWGKKYLSHELPEHEW